jgi:hypothetical protein
MGERMSHEQAQEDAQTWVPVAFFTFVEQEGKEPQLCQLWASVLGQTEWREVKTRNLKEMGRVFDECTVFEPTGGPGEEDA